MSRFDCPMTWIGGGKTTRFHIAENGMSVPMTLMLEPQEGESIYDPTCGSGGMLLSAAVEVKRQGREWRNLKLFGQERNLLTSAIARMNLFLHGFEDFQIVRGDTLAEPKLIEDGKLSRIGAKPLL